MLRRNVRSEGINAEGFIWLTVLLFVLACRQRDFHIMAAWPTICTFLQFFFCSTLMPSRVKSGFWRPCEDQGLFMNIVLVPCLAQCIASVQDGNFSLYAKWITILAFPNKTTVILSAFVMPLFDPILRSSRSLLFVLIWLVSTRYLSKLFRGIVTYGEFGVLNSIWTITFFEWSQEIIKSKTDITHAFISLSGVVGCVYTCWAVSLMKTHPWWARLVCHILGPLTLLETSLWFKKKTQYTFGDNFPLSLKWLYEFLKSKENGYPRYVSSVSIWILFFFGLCLNSMLVLDTLDCCIGVLF